MPSLVPRPSMHAERRGPGIYCRCMHKILHTVGQSCLNFEANKAALTAVTFDDTAKHTLDELQLSCLTLNEQQHIILEHKRLYIRYRHYIMYKISHLLLCNILTCLPCICLASDCPFISIKHGNRHYYTVSLVWKFRQLCTTLCKFRTRVCNIYPGPPLHAH